MNSLLKTLALSLGASIVSELSSTALRLLHSALNPTPQPNSEVVPASSSTETTKPRRRRKAASSSIEPPVPGLLPETGSTLSERGLGTAPDHEIIAARTRVDPLDFGRAVEP